MASGGAPCPDRAGGGFSAWPTQIIPCCGGEHRKKTQRAELVSAITPGVCEPTREFVFPATFEPTQTGVITELLERGRHGAHERR